MDVSLPASNTIFRIAESSKAGMRRHIEYRILKERQVVYEAVKIEVCIDHHGRRQDPTARTMGYYRTETRAKERCQGDAQHVNVNRMNTTCSPVIEVIDFDRKVDRPMRCDLPGIDLPTIDPSTSGD